MTQHDVPPHSPSGSGGGRGKQRTTLLAALVAGLFVIGASVAFACIPWAGELQLDNVDADSDESSTTTYGADHTDVTGNGNGQGMVWCDVDDPNGFGQQYEWAQVRPDGTDADDVVFTVDASDCDSDVYLPEDEYRITFVEDSFTNVDGSSGDVNGDGVANPTFADNRDSASNGGVDEVTGSGFGQPGGEDDTGHCMDIEDDGDDKAGDVIFDLVEDDDGDGVASVGDGDGVDDERFTSDNDLAPNGDHRDVVDEGPHSMAFDFDQFEPAAGLSGTGLDPDVAAGLCISSVEDFEHDNNDADDGDKDNIQIDIGNAVPVNVLPSL